MIFSEHYVGLAGATEWPFTEDSHYVQVDVQQDGVRVRVRLVRRPAQRQWISHWSYQSKTRSFFFDMVGTPEAQLATTPAIALYFSLNKSQVNGVKSFMCDMTFFSPRIFAAMLLAFRVIGFSHRKRQNHGRMAKIWKISVYL